MSKTSELEQKALALRQKRQQDTEQKLENGIKQIFSDTETILKERANILSKSISKETLSLRKQDSQATKELKTQILSNKESLKKQQSEATSEIIEQITTDKKTLQKAHTQAMNELQAAHKKQVESLQESLQKSNLLQAEIVQQVTLKKVLTTSIFPLIFLVSILVIVIGSLGYLSKEKYSEWQDLKAKKDLEEARVLEVQNLLTMSKQEALKKYPQLRFKD